MIASMSLNLVMHLVVVVVVPVVLLDKHVEVQLVMEYFLLVKSKVCSKLINVVELFSVENRLEQTEEK